MCNFYKNSRYDDTYILVGILENQIEVSRENLSAILEEHIAENLKRFENTQFYSHRVKFEYEKSMLDEETGDRLIFGKLKSNCNGFEMTFYGYYIESPVAYVLGICKNGEQLDAIKTVIDGAISSVYVSGNSGCEENE